MQKIGTYFNEHRLFLVSLILALISCIVGKFSVGYIDMKVIFSLFGLMLLIQGFEATGLLQFVAEKLLHLSQNSRRMVQFMILLALVSSMILTNDVAILTLLPIYFKILAKTPSFKGWIAGSVLIIVAANLGSSFFPFGNPQNLYLYDYYHVSFFQFLFFMGSVLAVSVVLLALATIGVEKKPLDELEEDIPPVDRKGSFWYSFLMLLMIAVVLNALPYLYVVPIVAMLVFLTNRQLLLKVDYSLLGVFVCFFLIVGNIGEAPIVHEFLGGLSNGQVYLASIGLSQVISNVPAAFLIAPFTDNQQAVITGVNIGGLGTLIASLANLIGYNLFKQAYPEKATRFVASFTWINVVLLILLGGLFYFVIH